ncbi:MAG: hypothetical protein H9993_02625 [Candidatus Desulfovibrio faecigallinarum]|nr:hypothetical protein [Candidatus Desulfovibrio faecigallinarum]
MPLPVTIVPVSTHEELTTFVTFPWEVYRDHPLWVPPIVKDDMALLSPGKHPFWETARRKLFMAMRGDRAVGRIAAIVDDKSNSYWQEKCGAFGFFECLPDDEAALALLRSAAQWLRDQGMDFMRGPLNPSTNYTCGLLVEGFDVPPGLMMPWNPPYYAKMLHRFCMRKEQDLLAYHIYKDRVQVAPWIESELARLKKKGDFTFRRSKKATLARDVEIMLQIYGESWAKNFAFSPLSETESRALVKELVSFLDPRFFVLFFHGDEPAGGMVALPNFNPLLRRLNGRMGLSALWHYLVSRRKIRESYRIMLFGIREKYRLLGLPLLLFDYMLAQARAQADFRWVEGSWVLEDNAAVDDLIEDFGGEACKRYRIYRKDLL